MDSRATGQAKSFGQVIRERRVELGLTQEQLAERIGEHVRQSDVSRMERDYISLPRRDRLEALAKALNVSPGYLLMHSGWITREERDRIDALHLTPPPSGEVLIRGEVIQSHERDGISGSPAPGILPSRYPAAESSLLQEVLERARHEQERTGELLRQTAATIDRARRSRRVPTAS